MTPIFLGHWGLKFYLGPHGLRRKGEKDVRVWVALRKTAQTLGQLCVIPIADLSVHFPLKSLCQQYFFHDNIYLSKFMLL